MASMCDPQSDASNRTIARRLNPSALVMRPNSIEPPNRPAFPIKRLENTLDVLRVHRLCLQNGRIRFAIEAQVHPTAVRRILDGLFDEIADEGGDDEWVFGQRGRIGRREAEVDLACGGLRQKLREYSLRDLIKIARLAGFLGRAFT